MNHKSTLLRIPSSVDHISDRFIRTFRHLQSLMSSLIGNNYSRPGQVSSEIASNIYLQDDNTDIYVQYIKTGNSI